MITRKIIRPLKNRLRHWLKSRGWFVYSRSTLPRGIRLDVDLARFRALADFSTVVDIGANEGQTAAQFLACFPRARILSFEPVPATFRRLAAAFGRHARVTCENLAASTANEEMQMLVGAEADSFVSRIVDETVPEDAVWHRQTVRAVRLDDYLHGKNIPRIDLLKTDTEGHDLSVLTGCGALLDGRRISFVLCEVGFTAANSGNSHLAEIGDYLRRHDYRFFALYPPAGWTPSLELVYADALFVSRALLDEAEAKPGGQTIPTG
jgi:FkbM family methyltransferase